VYAQGGLRTAPPVADSTSAETNKPVAYEFGFGVHPIPIAGDIEVSAGWLLSLHENPDVLRFHGPYIESSLRKWSMGHLIPDTGDDEEPDSDGLEWGVVLSAQARLVTDAGFESDMGFGGQLRLSAVPFHDNTVSARSGCRASGSRSRWCGASAQAGRFLFGFHIAGGPTRVASFTSWQLMGGITLQLPAAAIAGAYIYDD
jgi:hypothetical protein